ncbi:MAG: CYTH domain-containing protein, partial [bacterium]|nr:CYTH domain-containing protein [bacterium]
VKGVSTGITRMEFEYEIPLADANGMLDNLCETPLIEKTRYVIPYEGFTWEVDEFHGENAGLIVAEVELEDENQEFRRPPWVGEEVSDDPRYFNANLVEHPYTTW